MKKIVSILLLCILCHFAMAQDTITYNDTCYLELPLRNPIAETDVTMIENTNRAFGYSYGPFLHIASDTTIYGVAATLDSSTLIDTNLYSHLIARIYYPISVQEYKEYDSVATRWFHDPTCVKGAFKERRYKYNMEDDSMMCKVAELYFPTPRHLSAGDSIFVTLGLDTLGSIYQPPLLKYGFVKNDIDHLYVSPLYMYFAAPVYVRATNRYTWGGVFPISGLRCSEADGLMVAGREGQDVMLTWQKDMLNNEPSQLSVGADRDHPERNRLIDVAENYRWITDVPADEVWYARVRRACRYCSEQFDTTVYSGWSEPIAINGSNSIDEASDGFNFTVAPNPATGSVGIRFGAPLPSAATLTLIDLEGRQVAQHPIAAGEASFTLPLEGIHAGIYMLIATTREHICAHRIVVK